MGVDNGDHEEVPSWGTSLPVECVQEIVRKDPSNVPEKYIHDFDYTQTDVVLTHLSSDIPVIDLSLLSNGDEIELQKLDLACRDWGFFQIINHGIEAQILQEVKENSAKFFELPIEEKTKFSMASDDVQGFGQVYVVSEEQKLDWADLFILVVYPTKFRKWTFWPTTPPEFIKAIEAYSSEANRVAKELFGSLSILLGMEKESLLKLHDEVMQALRINYYPTCSMPDKVIGVSPHSDTSTLTVLLQDDEVTGLQIRHSGGWVPVKPIPNALVLNVGDVLEVLSNGKYKSIEHRAMTNENKVRMSIASFMCPQDDVQIEPLDTMVDGTNNERMYKRIRYGDFLRYSLQRKMDGKSHTNLIKFRE
ncbi:(S)-norcoclaurine synthase protein [Dioscorea alata]|uniref:(S)-norcoclaurine synthase protein n=1 Tax=Dioscorea alata TaxID=55571 RepID=A0ACB7VM27_DIOAL|nr:(S)-norcoclaurine synthase protein [Dioscorea alata]